MKFQIDYSAAVEQRVVRYHSKEYSFDTEPQAHEMDFDLSYNSLTLTVCNNRIVQIWGYSGDVIWGRFEMAIPDYQEGALKVKPEKFEYGFSYRINESPVPVFKNENTGWACLGIPDAPGEGVKFMDNCVAFIDPNGQFLSLWIGNIANLS